MRPFCYVLLLVLLGNYPENNTCGDKNHSHNAYYNSACACELYAK